MINCTKQDLNKKEANYLNFFKLIEKKLLASEDFN